MTTREHGLKLAMAFAVFGLTMQTLQAEDTRGVVVRAQSSGNRGSGINKELQRLFNESGQQMPSMETEDLPYATTPRMERVRRVEVPPRRAKKKVGLFDKLFGRFRRKRTQDEEPVIEPPLSSQQPDRYAAHSTRRPSRELHTANDSQSRQVPRAAIAASQVRRAEPKAQMVRRSPETAATNVEGARAQTASMARPVATPAADPEMPVVDWEANADDFVNPFDDIDSITVTHSDEVLDLDAVTEVVAPEAPLLIESEIANVAEVDTSIEQVQSNPFTGVQLQESDEFANPFVDNEFVQTESAILSDAQPEMVESEVGGSFADFSELSAANEMPLRSASDQLKTSVVAQSRKIQPEESSEGWSPVGRESADMTAATAADESAPIRRLTRRELIAERSHLSGFLGFCPVMLRDEQQLVDGDERFTERFGLKTYKFSSQVAADAFKANPAKYAPVAGGADVVALVNASDENSGSIRHAMWYRDRLYMFHSQETKDLFCDTPAKFADAY